MWYPEESVTYCPSCDIEIPTRCYWRGRGYSINGQGRQARIRVLYSQCPHCGARRSAGLDGPLWYRLLYEWLWRLRYPRRRPPKLAVPAERRRAAGE
jgi:hypothetical protein